MINLKLEVVKQNKISFCPSELNTVSYPTRKQIIQKEINLDIEKVKESDLTLMPTNLNFNYNDDNDLYEITIDYSQLTITD